MEPANLLKIDGLSDRWCDKDHVLLHASFQLLTDFVEKEMMVQDYPDWNATEETKNARKEMEELYVWWQAWRTERITGTSTSFKEDHDNYLQENEMLKRLIDIRMYMWT